MKLLQGLEEGLQRNNIEYAAKRASRRLGPPRLALIPTLTWQRWDRDRLARTGGTLEQYKHPCLIGDLQFHKKMPVSPPVE